MQSDGYEESKQDYMWPGDGLTCTKKCPISAITKTIPQFEDVLGLYYHCKLCSVPQAYLEQEAFIEHVQECHPDYCEDETKAFPASKPRSKTAAAQADSVTRKRSGSKKTPGRKRKSKLPEIEEQIKYEEGNTGNTEESSAYEEIKYEEGNPGITEESSAYEEAKAESIKEGDADTAVGTQVTAVGAQDTAVGAQDTAVEAQDTESMGATEAVPATEPAPQNAANEMELIIEWDTHHTNSLNKDEIAQQILGAIEENRDQLILQPDGSFTGNFGGSDNAQPTKGLPNLSKIILEKATDEQNTIEWQDMSMVSAMNIPPGRCKICREPYKAKHAATCKRKHKAEKPSCDAYVCAYGYNEHIYPCVRCDRVFLTDKLLRRHMNKYMENLELTCDLCEMQFKLRAKLTRHIMKCKGPIRFECRQCDRLFNNKQNLIRHLKNHAGIKSCFCEFCGKGFSSSSTLKIHIRNHTGERPYKCKLCPAAFKTKSHLLRHGYKHDTGKKYICEICGASYVDKSGLVRHSAVHQEGGRPKERHECTVCGKVLASKRQLREHHISYHSKLPASELKKFPCEICHKGFRSKRNLFIHTMIHTGVKPYKCETCGKGFYKSTDLKIHTRVHTGDKPYKCEYCNRGFSISANLAKHRYLHTGERPFVCQLCGRKFADRSHLNRHIKVHTGEKPFECDVCQRKFATKQQRNQHLLVHSDVAPFICAVCGKTFRQRAKANKHKCLYTLQDKDDSAYNLLRGDGNAIIVDESGEPIGIEPDEMVIEQSDGGQEVLVKVIDEHGDAASRRVIMEGQEDGENIAYHVVNHGSGDIAYQVIKQ